MINIEIAKQRSDALLVAMVGKQMVDDWWNSPNMAFDMRSPVDVWKDDYNLVYDYLIHHAFIGGGS